MKKVDIRLEYEEIHADYLKGNQGSHLVIACNLENPRNQGRRRSTRRVQRGRYSLNFRHLIVCIIKILSFI